MTTLQLRLLADATSAELLSTLAAGLGRSWQYHGIGCCHLTVNLRGPGTSKTGRCLCTSSANGDGGIACHASCSGVIPGASDRDVSSGLGSLVLLCGTWPCRLIEVLLLLLVLLHVAGFSSDLRACRLSHGTEPTQMPTNGTTEETTGRLMFTGSCRWGIQKLGIPAMNR